MNRTLRATIVPRAGAVKVGGPFGVVRPGTSGNVRSRPEGPLGCRLGGTIVGKGESVAGLDPGATLSVASRVPTR